MLVDFCQRRCVNVTKEFSNDNRIEASFQLSRRECMTEIILAKPFSYFLFKTDEPTLNGGGRPRIAIGVAEDNAEVVGHLATDDSFGSWCEIDDARAASTFGILYRKYATVIL